MDYLPEKEYQKIIKSMPIFCIDFLISFQNRYLLIKRKEEPLKNLYWVIGGRLMFKEKITHAAKRIQEREIGTYFSNFREIGFSNYFFPDKQNSRATHTPTLLFHIAVKKMFNPILDEQHNNFIWSENIPKELIKQTIFFNHVEDIYNSYMHYNFLVANRINADQKSQNNCMHINLATSNSQHQMTITIMKVNCQTS